MTLSKTGLESSPTHRQRLVDSIPEGGNLRISQRLAAARSLGDMGANAKGAIPGLTKSLSDRDAFVRSAAAHSLGKIGPDAASAVPAMVTAFKRASGFDQGIIGP